MINNATDACRLTNITRYSMAQDADVDEVLKKIQAAACKGTYTVCIYDNLSAGQMTKLGQLGFEVDPGSETGYMISWHDPAYVQWVSLG